MLVTVENKCLPEFKKQLPSIGCAVVRVRPRRGRSKSGKTIRNVEISLPTHWQGSMSGAIYNLPGVLMLGGVIDNRPSLIRWFGALRWYVGRSKERF